jgi:ABC-type bacteriocin/lantibiotic exporter with double-glycine peptidase domain
MLDLNVIDLHIGRQIFDFDCGAQALQVVLAYYGVEIRGDALMRALGTGPEGTPLANMIAFGRDRGFQVEAGTGWTLKKAKRFVDAGHPVIVLLQAWTKRFMTLEDWRRNDEDGHYAILIGYAKGVLLFEDPASFRRTWLREVEFLARWHDRDPRTGELLKRFGMVLLGKPPADRTPEPMR